MTARSPLRRAVPVAARGGRARALAALLLALPLTGLLPAVAPARLALAAPGTFSNPAPISVPATGTGGAGDAGKATPYPSTITVAGEGRSLTKVTVTLHGLTHAFLSDLDVLLVAPSGQSVLLLSDVGPSDDAVTDVTLTFDDAAAMPVPTSGSTIPSGTCRPTSVEDGDPDAFPPPAPATGTPWATALGALTGHDPNGTWSLYVVDQYEIDTGTIAGGWSLTIDAAGATPSPTATAAATASPTVAPTTTAPVADPTTTAPTGTATVTTTPIATVTPAPPSASSPALAAAPTAAGAAGPGAPLPNRRPTARGDRAATAAGVPVALVVTDNNSDPDDDPLTIKEVRPPHHGTARCEPVDARAFRRRWRCVYTPAPGFAGTDDFAYAVADPSGETSTATVHVAVAPAPSPTATAPPRRPRRPPPPPRRCRRPPRAARRRGARKRDR